MLRNSEPVPKFRRAVFNMGAPLFVLFVTLAAYLPTAAFEFVFDDSQQIVLSQNVFGES